MDDSDFLPLLTDTSPGSPEMDRDELGPRKHQQLESLHQKLLAHYRKGIGKSEHEEMPSTFPSEFINRVSVLLYLFTVFSTLKIGLLDVMPLVYEGRNHIVLLQQCFVLFIFMEVMINWLHIRYVGSSYREYINLYGDQHLHHPSLSEKQLTNKTTTEDTSSAVLMPLMTQTGQAAVKKYSPLDTPTDLNSDGESVMAAKCNLKEEAERVNQWMYRRNEQMDSKSIADLICVCEDTRVSWSSSVRESRHVSATKVGIHNLMSPRPVIRRAGNTVTESYPYWSWVPCYVCGFTRPPRCHHCPLCKTCVLKRDHHCFFAGSCIGYRNHRFFVVFLFWALIGCVYATLHGIPYIGLFMWPLMSCWDVFFPVAITRCMLGYLPFHIALSVTTLSILVVFDMFSAVYLYSQIRLITLGLTSFERSNLKSSLEITDMRKLSQKLRAVFGQYWFLNVLFPAHLILKAEEDPIYWPEIRIAKH